jgi:hypothetical protein
MNPLNAPIVMPILSLLLGLAGGFLAFWSSHAKYQQKVDHLDREKNNTTLVLNEFRSDIATLKEFKVQAQKFIDRIIYQSSSPLSLTKLGLQMVEESGFKDIFHDEKNNLAALLARKSPLTKYDTQEMARELMDNLREYPAFTPIKSYAYNTGKDFGQILRAGAILLRDYYLSIHPEIVS